MNEQSAGYQPDRTENVDQARFAAETYHLYLNDLVDRSMLDLNLLTGREYYVRHLSQLPDIDLEEELGRRFNEDERKQFRSEITQLRESDIEIGLLLGKVMNEIDADQSLTGERYRTMRMHDKYALIREYIKKSGNVPEDKKRPVEIQALRDLTFRKLVKEHAAVYSKNTYMPYNSQEYTMLDTAERGYTNVYFSGEQDKMTGLPRREGIYSGFKNVLDDIHRKTGNWEKDDNRWDEPAISIWFIDVNKLKKINDGISHPAADLYLKMLGRLFGENLRRKDKPGRWGGDEFNLISTYGSSGLSMDNFIAGKLFGKIDEMLASFWNGIDEDERPDSSENVGTCTVGVCPVTYREARMLMDKMYDYQPEEISNNQQIHKDDYASTEDVLGFLMKVADDSLLEAKKKPDRRNAIYRVKSGWLNPNLGIQDIRKASGNMLVADREPIFDHGELQVEELAPIRKPDGHLGDD